MDARRYVKVAQDIYIDTVGPENAKRKSPLVEIIVCLVIVFILAVILFPFFNKARESDGHGPSCQSNMKQLGLGILQYTQDYDECYPPAAIYDVNVSSQPPYGWADAIYPYTKSQRIYYCPLNRIEHSTNPRSVNFTDYWMNRDMCQAYLADVKHPATTLLLGDGNDGREATNARYTLRALPFSWKDDYASPSYRHSYSTGSQVRLGANYCYADGHVKWRSGEAATQADASNFSFALK